MALFSRFLAFIDSKWHNGSKDQICKCYLFRDPVRRIIVLTKKCRVHCPGFPHVLPKTPDLDPQNQLTDLLSFVDYGLIRSKLADSGRRSRIIANEYILHALKTGRGMCSGALKIEKYKHLLPI